MKNQKYYVGLDIGTNSVGYAVTDEEYNLLKFHGEPAWGVTVFDEGSLNDERRSFRSARRRLDRRQQRVDLVQELFASEIAKIDERFFVRIQESYKYRDEVGDKFIFFNDENYTDIEYNKEFPTIHHLIKSLMINDKTYDVRLVYIAIAWLVAHRGHFLSNIEVENISKFSRFENVYEEFVDYFSNNGYEMPWGKVDIMALGDALKKKTGVNNKNKELLLVLNNGASFKKIKSEEDIEEGFPFAREGIVKLLAGGTYSLKELFCKEEYDEVDPKSITLNMDDEKLAAVASYIGDDFGLIEALKKIADWAVLVDSLGNFKTISEAKVSIYEQHRKDLKALKSFIKKYRPEKYKEVFSDIKKDTGNYVAYTLHSDQKDKKELKATNYENFSKYIKNLVKDIEVEESDKAFYEDMIRRLETADFLPKQKTTDNRVIPHQLYEYELNEILKNASEYLDFLGEKDDSGLTVAEKIKSIFKFRIPYFVGPLNRNSDKSWVERKAEGKIYPWNFNDLVDFDKSEDAFIANLTNKCTYLAGENVLPKDSLLYHKYSVLNEINNIKINGVKISVELKQELYNEVFMSNPKVTLKKIQEFFIKQNVIKKGEESSITGIDIKINSNLRPQIAFRSLLERDVLTENDVERIIERSTYAEDKARLKKWLEKEYPNIADEDRKYICGLKFKDFGRLSRKFLGGMEGVLRETGEYVTIISALWQTQYNLMELLAEDISTYKNVCEEENNKYYSDKSVGLEDRLDEMYLSNTVKRQVYRTLAILKDITKAFGIPSKIMVEMTRGSNPQKKTGRTKSRLEQIQELYRNCDQDTRVLSQQLEAMGIYAETKLRSDKLFLYYMQLGKCMYTGEPIGLENLATDKYNIDHIYPQAYIKDDSILNNKVLVKSEINGKKSDVYPIEDFIRAKMAGYWRFLHDSKLIEDEKFKRLTRNTPFTEEEKHTFIKRQLTETSQSTKAIATLLKERYGNEVEIVYSKANLISEFRQEFDLLKSRSFNDLHHAVDAYLNIVVGNVYNSKFTKNFNVNQSYTIKVRTLFEHEVKCGNAVVWNGATMLAKVKKTAVKNNAHFTKFAYFKKGGFFDQQLVKKSADKTPIKAGMETEKYGGYNKAGVEFFIPVKYKVGKKEDVMVMSVEHLVGSRFICNENFAIEYSYDRLKHILGKEVSEVSFPMGMRPWKINTVLSLDGFKVCIAGISSAGKCLIAQPLVQFSASEEWQKYLKRLESFVDKSQNKGFIYDAKYDYVNKGNNIRLYELYMDKLQNSIYNKRLNSPIEKLINGKNRFENLDIFEQCKALLNIHQVFGRISGGIDLRLIGGVEKDAATISFSSKISNWKKYSDIRIVDTSPSGLWSKQSQNLLELL